MHEHAQDSFLTYFASVIAIFSGVMDIDSDI